MKRVVLQECLQLKHHIIKSALSVLYNVFVKKKTLWAACSGFS